MVQHVSHRHSDEIAQLNAKIILLRAELSYWKLSAKNWEKIAEEQLVELRQTAEEIARLREALTFYEPGPPWYNAKIANDEGVTAAIALAPRSSEGK